MLRDLKIRSVTYAVCKNRKGELGNGMRRMRGTEMGMRGIWVRMQGIGVGIRGKELK